MTNPQTAAAKIKKLSRLRPTLALLLGSGFGHVQRKLEVDGRIAYAKLPGFPKPGVEGHDGELLIGRLGGTPVLVLAGRAHFYEGHSMEHVTFPIRVLAELDVTDLLLTCAAGGINRKFRPGDFMVLTDHINLMGANPLRPLRPLRGSDRKNSSLPRFVDLTEVYDKGLRGLLFQSGKLSRLKLQRGVYAAVSGPSYETPAEIRAFARLGADAVGMSTVPEAVVARQCGLRVAAVSCITNPAAGPGRAPLSHQEVLETAQNVEYAASALLENFAGLYPRFRPGKC
jgi:purine-nucleoside phosphorylase